MSATLTIANAGPVRTLTVTDEGSTQTFTVEQKARTLQVGYGQRGPAGPPGPAGSGNALMFVQATPVGSAAIPQYFR